MKKTFRLIPIFTATALAFSMSAVSCHSDKDHSHSEQSEHNDNDDHDHDAHDDHDGHDDHDHDEHDGHDHSGMIHLKPEVAASFGVATEKIDNSDFSEVILVSGVIEALPSDEAVISATRSGVVTLNSDISAGSSISAGKSIGHISPSSVQGGDPGMQASARRDAAKRELDRLTPLHNDGVVSTATYNAALQAYEEADAEARSMRQGSTSLVTPKGGVITNLNVRSGQYVEAGQPVATVSGNARLTLRADVPERYASRISSFVSANVRAASASGAVSLDDLGGKLISSPAAVSVGGYIPVRFSFVNDGSMTPGSYAEVYLKSGARGGVISVPLEAIVEVNGNHIIYSRHGDDYYEKHVVELGVSDGRSVEILSGLEPGEEVVTKGAQVIRMAETSATAVPGHTHNH
ncbi:MAG: efflux RND transporter periplasmic adaptor subunit [Muribaculaceae bacterium]|nr:efflux RND transporter periplasmic adaptor subunit [Muribaculaceae bacterium]